jgi:hypothetical protein
MGRSELITSNEQSVPHNGDRFWIWGLSCGKTLMKCLRSETNNHSHTTLKPDHSAPWIDIYPLGAPLQNPGW